MTSIADQVAQNTKDIETLKNIKGAAVVRICGEEHQASSVGGTATLFLPHDNDMCYISDYKFKLVIGNGGVDSGSGGGTPVPVSILRGTASWPTLADFKAYYPLGSAIDVDGAYGCMCWDYASAFWWGQCNRGAATGGNNAKGMWLNARSVNQGTEFDLITSWSDILPGDWIIWNNGTYGHVAMAVNSPNGSYVNVWEQNGKNGYAWPAGGSTLAQSTLDSGGFLGAFRYKAWHSS